MYINIYIYISLLCRVKYSIEYLKSMILAVYKRTLPEGISKKKEMLRVTNTTTKKFVP